MDLDIIKNKSIEVCDNINKILESLKKTIIYTANSCANNIVNIYNESAENINKICEFLKLEKNLTSITSRIKQISVNIDNIDDNIINYVNDILNKTELKKEIQKEIDKILKDYCITETFETKEIYKEELIKYINSKEFDEKLKEYVREKDPLESEVEKLIENWNQSYKEMDISKTYKQYKELLKYEKTIDTVPSLKREFEYLKLITEYMVETGLKPTDMRLEFFKQWSLENAKFS